LYIEEYNGEIIHQGTREIVYWKI